MRKSVVAAAVILGSSISGPITARGQQTTRVSVDSSEKEKSQASNGTSISADGRFAVFDSAANFGGSSKPGVYVRDRATGLTELVSVDSSGHAGDASSFAGVISADGRFVAFQSVSTNLVAGDANGTNDVFVHERATGITERVSVDSAGAQASQGSSLPAISADGRFVAFESDAPDLVPGDTNSDADVFVRDRVNGTTVRASVDSAGDEADDASNFAAISAEGAFVAFESWATDLVANDANGHVDIFVHELATGATTRVSVKSNGVEADDDSYLAAISADGGVVSFSSRAKNLVANDTNKKADVFVHDRATATTTRVSVDSSGAQLDLHSDVAAISGDGNVVAFRSRPRTDPSARIDLWRHDRTTGATTLVGVTPQGAPCDGSSWTWTQGLSLDGGAIVFTSVATDLVAGDGNGVQDVFVRGPWLTLQVDPAAATSGSAITLTLFTGKPSALFVLAAVDLNATPLFLVLIAGTFDANGAWIHPDVVPPGLAGNVIELQAFGIVETGKVQASDRETLALQ